MSPAWFEPGTLSFEIAKGLPAAVIASAVGLVLAGIALRQFNVARAKMNLDLFNERYKLFELLWSFISKQDSDIASDGPNDSALHDALPKFYFLYEPEIGLYVDKVLNQARELRWAKSALRRMQGEVGVDQAQRSKNHSAVAELATWFSGETSEILQRFSKYLSFEAWTNLTHQ